MDDGISAEITVTKILIEDARRTANSLPINDPGVTACLAQQIRLEDRLAALQNQTQE